MLNIRKIPFDIDYLNNRITSLYKIITIFESISSTNTFLKENSDVLNHGTVIIAKHQSSGRGRFDRKFESNHDSGIYCSFLLKENLSNESMKHINLRIACALRDSIKDVFNIDTIIKWPNDLLINQKKCAGILIETQIHSNTQQAIVIGFGLNVYKQKFSQSLSTIATTLEENCTIELNRNDLLVHFFNHLDEYLDHKDIINLFKKHMLPINSFVNLSINNTKESVKIIDLDKNGQLIVLDKKNALLTLFNEEISID